MPPLCLVEPVKTRYLNIAEREKIHAGISAGFSIRDIAEGLGRAPSTVSRELVANMGQQYCRAPASGGRHRSRPWDYSPHLAQQRADATAARPKPAKLAVNPRLRAYVQEKLTCPQRWSPEQISHRLVIDFPDDEQMRISPEGIYQSLYVQGRGALRRELTVCLRTGRAVRKPHRQPDQRRTRQIPAELMISARPAEINDRAVPGHWEGDLITGTANKSAIGTLVERSTRFVLLLHLPADHRAETVRDQIAAQILTLPAALRRSLTWDQGAELAQHAQISIDTDLAIYFCDPHSPWQRGTNENTNGLLRQYFPKATDLSVHSADDLAEVAAGLNGRPRKTLGWRTPAEALNQLLSTAS
jgi:IS30 family transposase